MANHIYVVCFRFELTCYVRTYVRTLDKIFFADKVNLEVKNMICSILAGYVWDQDNPYVKDHNTALKKLARLIEIEQILAD